MIKVLGSLRRRGTESGAESNSGKGGSAGTGQAAGHRVTGLPGDGLQPRQLLPLQGSLRQRRRGGAGGDLAAQAGAQESSGAENRAGELHNSGSKLVATFWAPLVGQESGQAALLEGELRLIKRRPREAELAGRLRNALALDTDLSQHLVFHLHQVVGIEKLAVLEERMGHILGAGLSVPSCRNSCCLYGLPLSRATILLHARLSGVCKVNDDKYQTIVKRFSSQNSADERRFITSNQEVMAAECLSPLTRFDSHSRRIFLYNPRSRPCLSSPICLASSIRSATRNNERPAATATNGSTVPASVQLVGSECTRPSPPRNHYSVLTPTPAVSDQLKPLLEQRMVRMGYSETSLLSASMRRI